MNRSGSTHKICHGFAWFSPHSLHHLCIRIFGRSHHRSNGLDYQIMVQFTDCTLGQYYSHPDFGGIVLDIFPLRSACISCFLFLNYFHDSSYILLQMFHNMGFLALVFHIGSSIQYPFAILLRSRSY